VVVLVVKSRELTGLLHKPHGFTLELEAALNTIELQREIVQWSGAASSERVSDHPDANGAGIRPLGRVPGAIKTIADAKSSPKRSRNAILTSQVRAGPAECNASPQRLYEERLQKASVFGKLIAMPCLRSSQLSHGDRPC
jgi:hypothetical protein